MWLYSYIVGLLILMKVQASPPNPHLVFIVADDFGWNDVGYHNPDIISPTIDKLAGSGIKLNQSYVQPLCSPSRTAFMTGVYPFRLGLSHLVIGENQDVCVPLNATFFPKLLKSNGYATHMIGKWHLGFCKWECTPTYRGFDTFYGFYSGGEDYYTHIFPNGYDYRNDVKINKASTGNYSTYEFAGQAEKLISNHDPNTPFYLYMPFQSVHMPLQVPQKYLDMYPNIKNQNRKALSAMVTSMDDAIARIIDALKDRGMYNDTIIVFSADNGGWTTFGGNNYPLRGGKLSIFEGGTRVPAFIHSPKLNKTGVTHNGMVHAVDWFPTLAKALGINYTDTSGQDGVDQWEAITALGPSKRNEIVYNLDYHPQPLQGQSAIRVGDYKLIEGYPGLYQSWYKPADIYQGFNETQTLLEEAPNSYKMNYLGSKNLAASYKYLFNLKDDPYEHNNLFAKLPDIVKQLQDKMTEQLKRYVPPNYPPNSKGANPRNFGGVWSPGWC